MSFEDCRDCLDYEMDSWAMPPEPNKPFMTWLEIMGSWYVE